jgi:hypothetical protein
MLQWNVRLFTVLVLVALLAASLGLQFGPGGGRQFGW